MKKALIGLADNVSKNINKVKVWSRSFREHSSDSIVLLCGNASEEDIAHCKRLGIIPVSVTIQDSMYINHERLKHLSEFLKSTDIELFVSTDVFDVVFQGDPFAELDVNSYDLFISGEGVKVNQEPWNSDNINKLFPSDFDGCKEIEIMNSGIIAGKRESLQWLFERMYNLCENGTDDHNIKDQAALIVMVARNEIPRLKIFNLDDGWAMHCAVAGPTQFFESWGFKNAIKYGIPRMFDGSVVNKSGKKYDMVHQFNRTPDWKPILEKNYHE